MLTGVIFDLKEFAVHDGPGLRTTVFLKGCPMNCTWCHNPEGKSCKPQVMHSPAGERLAGREYTSRELARLINAQADILRSNEGGVTFSGGEPLAQAAFVREVIDGLDDLHVLLDTSGYAPTEDFLRVASRSHLVYFDLKIIDPALFLHYTGGDIQVVLANLRVLSRLSIPYVIRVPLVPGVTDTPQNLAAIAGVIQNLPGLVRADLLPYNCLAGAKYRAAGLPYQPGFNEDQPVNLDGSAFAQAGLKWRIA